MKKCASCDHEYDDAYDGCPKCVKARQPEEPGLMVRAIDPRGRSSRIDFALVFLGSALVTAVLATLSDGELQRSSLAGPFTVLALSWTLLQAPFVVIAGIRRLHDLGKSGWMLLLAFVPIVNLFMILYLFVAPGSPEATEDTTATVLSRKLIWLFGVIGVLLVSAVGTTAYYSYYSDAVRNAERIPLGAAMGDVDKVLGRPERVSTAGNLRYMAYVFRDMSAIDCAYVGEQQTLTRKVLRSVEVQKTRQAYREVGWDYYLNMPRYDYVSEPYTTTELKLVSEDYEVTVWRVRSLHPTVDLTALKRRLGIGKNAASPPVKSATLAAPAVRQAGATTKPAEHVEADVEEPRKPGARANSTRTLNQTLRHSALRTGIRAPLLAGSGMARGVRKDRRSARSQPTRRRSSCSVGTGTTSGWSPSAGTNFSL